MPDEKFTPPIDYTHRDYRSIRNDLLQLAARYYPDNFRDFSEASFGALMLDAVAYVGDQLSFYLDYSVNESFLDTAYSYTNIARHGRVMGYKEPGPTSTYGQVALFIQVPAETAGLGPNRNYIPILKRGSRFTSENGLNFVLTSNVDFGDSKNPIVASQVNGTTGSPTYYAIKAYGNVVSGRFGRVTKKIGNFQRFLRIKLGSPSINEVISVIDSEGNEYYEVDYLSQDIVYRELANSNFKNDNVPSIMKPILVARKFVVVRERGGVYLQFGSGKEGETNVIADPQSVAMDMFGKSYTTSTSFDPTKLSQNNSMGIVPSNTTLTIAYRATNASNSNVSAGSLNKVASPILEYQDRSSLSKSILTTIQNSVEVNNEAQILGQNTGATGAELKARILDTFPTQNRAVTQIDYENIALRMPGKFGSVKRVSVQKDQNSLKRNLNMYVISQNSFGKLAKTNATIKNNLKTWLNDYRMINDTIDILDPYIINIGVNFSLKAQASATRSTVLASAMSTLRTLFSETLYIGEPVSIGQIYSALRVTAGVLDVKDVQLVTKTGSRYSNVKFSINKNLSPDGSSLICPKNAIFELKYPDVDIKGKIT